MFRTFRQLIEFFQPTQLRACATSAMREARNGAEAAELAVSEGRKWPRFVGHGSRCPSNHYACIFQTMPGIFLPPLGKHRRNRTSFVRSEPT